MEKKEKISKRKKSKEELAKKMQKRKKYTGAIGRRKRAVASVRLYEGGQNFLVNSKSILDYFQEKSAEKLIFDPLKLVGAEKKFDVTVKVRGGGKKSQVGAICHGIARALNKIDKTYHTSLKKEGYLTRDPREKERKKPGLKRARRAPQWQKR